VTAARRQASATPLTRERIVKVALEIVDRDGLKALSMRRLGSELGTDPMAVYYHIPNKEALLDGIVEAVMADIDISVDDPSAPAEERLLAAAREYRDTLLAHRNALPILLSRGPSTPVALRPVELLMSILRDNGLAPAQAMAGMNAIASTVRGMVGMVQGEEFPEPQSPEEAQQLAESFPADEFPNLREAAQYPVDYLETHFDFGIRALARGLLASAEG